MHTRLIGLALILAASGARPAPAQTLCAGLAGLKLPHTTITSATLVPAGPLSGPGAAAGAPGATVPAHCDVRAVTRPSSDSEIKFAVWLPADGWNGKYRQEGNGGWAGSIPVQSLVDGLRRGYATAATDDGHDNSQGAGAAWAIGHPEKLVDFGYRAVHETSEQAKAIVRAFYGRDAARAYFVGCSDGGREALMEAQRYADDFDGILAGAPASDWSHLFAGFVWNEQALLGDPAGSIPPAKLPAIQQAALASCDALDGVTDGLIENPRVCRFDPGVLACKGTDAADCLTAPQVEALRRIYAGPRNPRTGEQIFPGYPPGTEAVAGGWLPWIVPATPAATSLQSAFGNSYFGQAVFENPAWDFRSLKFDFDVAFAHAKLGAVINSSNPDLRSFRARGGKLIQYHGWGDAAIAPLSSIAYYENVRSFLATFPDGRGDRSRPLEDFYRLFMVPGMAHCGGGAGPNSFGNVRTAPAAGPERDIFTALERWVDTGMAPDQLIGSGTAGGDASKPMTRPLCPHPRVATYSGSGDPNDASSFTCKVP